MGKQTFEIEIDRNQVSEEQFDLIKNDLIKDIIKSSWNRIDRNDTSAHVKADFSKHAKGGISIDWRTTRDTIQLQPELFNLDSQVIERLRVTVEDINFDGAQ